MTSTNIFTIDIAELPTFQIKEGNLDVEKFLKIRESSEASEFREWLSSVGEASDKEVRERVQSLRATFGTKIGSQFGKAMRFLITTGVGLIPNAIVPAIALGFIDQFVLDKVLSCLSWNWRGRSSVKITERTHEKREKALHRRREGSHPEAALAG